MGKFLFLGRWGTTERDLGVRCLIPDYHRAGTVVSAWSSPPNAQRSDGSTMVPNSHA